MNAVAKAAGEVLEDQTGLYWLNSSTYLGNVYTCASTSTTGCSALGAGVSIQLIVDCGLNTTLKTDLQTYFQQWANTDPATGLTYNTDFAYRLIYYMNQENYEFTYSDAALHSMSMQPLVVSGIASVSKEDLSVGLPAATDMSTATVNPLTSDWMPQTSDGKSHHLVRKMSLPGILFVAHERSQKVEFDSEFFWLMKVPIELSPSAVLSSVCLLTTPTVC